MFAVVYTVPGTHVDAGAVLVWLAIFVCLVWLIKQART